MPGPITAASRPPPSASVAAAAIPARRPRQPTCSTAIAGALPFARATATGRQSAVINIIARPGSSLQSTSPGGWSKPAVSTPRSMLARTTPGPCCCHSIVASPGSIPTFSQSRVRFSITRSGSSPVSMPRFSDSKAPSLTPPRRVEKATSYGPGASHRKVGITLARSALARRRAPTRVRPAHRSACGDAAPRGSPPLAELGLGESPRVGEILEENASEPLEILAQLREVDEGEGEERRVGRVRLGECDDVRRRKRVGAQTLHDQRAERDSGCDPLSVAPPDFQALEPGVDLIGRQLASKRREAEPPGRNPEPVVLVELAEAIEQPDRFLVRREMGMNRLSRAELREAGNRVVHVALLEERHELLAEARAREVADETHLDAAPR